MLRSTALLAIVLCSLTLHSGCGGASNSSSPLDPDSYSVSSYSGKGFLATSASGAFVYLDNSNNVILVTPSGISTLLTGVTPGSTFYSSHISPNGQHVLVTYQASGPLFQLESKYFKSGVEQSIPPTPIGSTAPLMVDDAGFLYGAKPGETYRTNGNQTEVCTTPNDGFPTITLPQFAKGEDPKFLQEFNFAGGNIPTSRWFQFEAGSMPQIKHDLNGTNQLTFQVKGVTRNGTAFGRVVNSPTQTTFIKALDSSFEYGSTANVIDVFGKLDSGALFIRSNGGYMIEYKGKSLLINDITELIPSPDAMQSFAKGNSIFTYADVNSTSLMIVIRHR